MGFSVFALICRIFHRVLAKLHCLRSYIVEGILNPCGCMGQCMGGGKVCFEGEAMGLRVLHGWR